MLTLHLKHNTREHLLAAAATATVGELRAMIAAATGVPLALQTALVAKGLPPRALRDDLAATLGAIGLADGAKLLLVGSTPAAQQALLEVEDKAHRRLAAQDKARVQMQRHVAGLPAAPASPFRFHRIAPLPHYAAPHRTTAEAHAYLAALAADPFLLAIMARRRWTVAVLSEFAPSLETGFVGESTTCLLGFNRNRGEEISLRIRTNDHAGFSFPRFVLDTLFHELAHIECDAHDAAFYALNREIAREYAQLSTAHVLGGHSAAAAAMPPLPATGAPQLTAGDVMAATAKLSGQPLGSGGTAAVAGEAGLSPRAAAGLAALLRLTSAEQTLTAGCGCGAAHLPPVPPATTVSEPADAAGGSVDGDTAASSDGAAPCGRGGMTADLLARVGAAEELALGGSPYVYRPRRRLRIGADYQVALPSAADDDDDEGAGAPANPAQSFGPDRDERVSEAELDAAAAFVRVAAGAACSPALTHALATLRTAHQLASAAESSSASESSVAAGVAAMAALLRNVLLYPSVLRYRTVMVKPGSPLALPAAVAVLEQAGFVRHAAAGAAADADTDADAAAFEVLVLPADADPACVAAAAAALELALQTW